MDASEILKHVERLRLPDAGFEYVKQALTSPSRLVGQNRFLSVSARFASQKLGQVIQAESHTCELPFIYAQELDDEVIACLDQPPPLHVESIDRRGRLHRGSKTADFLVIRKTGVILFECKTRRELMRYVVEQPENWLLDDTGYRCLPMERSVVPLGIPFRVHDAGTIGPIYAANLSVLVDLQRSAPPLVSEHLIHRAMKLLSRHNGMTITILAIELDLDSITPILTAILHKQLHVAIHWQLLGKPESTTVYATEMHVRSAEQALKAAAEIDCLRERNYQAPLSLSKKAFNKAVENCNRIRRIRNGELCLTRNDYRLMRAVRHCEASGESPLMALAPAYHKRGSTRTIPDSAEKIIQSELQAAYANSVKWTGIAVHKAVTMKLEELGQSRVCYETVRQRIKKLSRTDLAMAREGYRAANAAMPPTPHGERAIRAGYAWEKAHVDSTPLDEKLWLGSPLGKILARPVIYILVDEATSCILAYWVCFDSAGDQAVACLFRDCVRRHGKLPRRIMHDRGSEYFSIFSEGFAAFTGVDLLRRPSAAGRWGSHVESAFNRINELVIHRLSGNTQNDRIGRTSTASVRSAAHARHDLLQFLSILEEALMEWLNNRPVENEVATPLEKLELSQKLFDGTARKIKIDPQFLANTAIPVADERRIDHARGIKFNHRRYSGAGISCPSLDRTKVPIRWEPYNPWIIYACVKGSWVRLACQGCQEVENSPHSNLMVELYMSSNTAPASKRAREVADRKMAARLGSELNAQILPREKVTVESVRPSNDDLFSQARSRVIGDGAETVP